MGSDLQPMLWAAQRGYSSASQTGGGRAKMQSLTPDVPSGAAGTWLNLKLQELAIFTWQGLQISYHFRIALPPSPPTLANLQNYWGSTDTWLYQ